MEPNQPNFGVNDLKVILNIITVVGSRGAIKPEEMAVVGELFNRITRFIAQAEAEAAAAKQEATPPEPPTPPSKGDKK